LTGNLCFHPGVARVNVRRSLETHRTRSPFIANYIPLESPAGGPNFPAFDETVLYEIHVDNNGDDKEDLTYQFRFHIKRTAIAS
jgi:hypothetical protein